MTRWWTSDLHLGHPSIITSARRPFTTVDQMDEWLLAAWNDTVGAHDEVWVLGDVAPDHPKRYLSRMARLHGRKILVPGNHDQCWSGKGPAAIRRMERFLAAGFGAVLQGPIALSLDGRPVSVSHFPYRGGSQTDESRYPGFRPFDQGGWLLHGHVHHRWRQLGRQVNVGVDAWGGRPVSDDTLARLLAAGPRDLAPLPWLVEVDRARRGALAVGMGDAPSGQPARSGGPGRI